MQNRANQIGVLEFQFHNQEKLNIVQNFLGGTKARRGDENRRGNYLI